VNSSLSWGQILNPFGALVLHLLHQRVQDLYEALLRPTWTKIRWYRVRTGWPCLLTRVPPIEQVDEHEHVFPANLIEMPLTYRFIRFKPTNSTNLRSWCPQNTATATQKLSKFSLSAHHNVICIDSPLASINSHKTTTISHRVQVQFGFGTKHNINWELSNKWAEFKS